MMKEMYLRYKNDISNKKIIIVSVFIIFILGLVFGSLYITILGNDEKKSISDTVTNYINSFNTISFSNKLNIFKDSLISNLVYFIGLWLLGISVIGIPIIYIMTFIRSFVISFSIGGIFAKYKLAGILASFIYLFPSKLIILAYSLFLAIYSVNISKELCSNAFKKKTLNFGSFMGKYTFLLLVGVLICVICALFEAFITPYLFKLIINLLK